MGKAYLMAPNMGHLKDAQCVVLDCSGKAFESDSDRSAYLSTSGIPAAMCANKDTNTVKLALPDL